MSEKRFFRALFKTVLFFAFFHLTLLVVLAVVGQRVEYLNIFEITGLSQFFPGIERGMLSFFISCAIILLVYYLFYRRIKKS